MHVLADLALSFALLTVLVNGVLYSIRARVLRRVAPCDAAERLGLIDAAWAFAQECGALAAALLLLPAACCTSPCGAGSGTRGTIILVHGWALNPGSLWLLRRRLLRDGWSPVCYLAYPSLRVDVELAARRLRDLLARLAADPTHHGPVMLVGHCLGGLVVRCCARRYPVPQVRRLVTLGTPHQGTQLARIGGPWARLAPDSKLLRTLNAADHLPQQFDVVAIHSTFDAVILPPANARYAGAFNVQLNNVGHHALLFSSKVYQLLGENLAAPLR